LVLVALAAADLSFGKFNDFILKYEKKYDSLEEFEFRFKVFQQNLDRIARMNAAHVAAGGGEVYGVNIFADRTREESQARLMKNLEYRAPHAPETYTNVIPPNDLVDWRTKGIVTPVKDQGQCGSCWAHSADEALESWNALYHNTTGSSVQVLSVQQCTACTYNYDGCNGGWPYDAYTNAVKNRNGIDLDADYPYNIPQAGNCKFGATGNADKPVTTDSTYKSVARGGLQGALQTTGPVSVCLAAEAWDAYTGGILKSCPGSVDHCVQAVGYNTNGAEPYWIVRNSWGVSWGDKGYIYLDMSVNNGDICHIQEYITYPVIASVKN